MSASEFDMANLLLEVLEARGLRVRRGLLRFRHENGAITIAIKIGGKQRKTA